MTFVKNLEMETTFMKKVIIWSDTHNFPSIAAMKISSFHKACGDDVKLFESAFDYCDVLYKSKAFSFTSDLEHYPQGCEQVLSGGSGYAIRTKNNRECYSAEFDSPLPNEIESQYPDYSLYPQFADNAYGFLTRGCGNNCPFCIVSKKEGLVSRKVADLSDFWRGQGFIKLMDGNLLNSRDREGLLQQLIDSKAKIDYVQGLDARFVTEDIAKLICKTRIAMIHFAFDNLKDETRILRGLEIFAKHTNLTDRNRRVYILTNYETTQDEDWYRVQKVRELGYQPYITIYQKGTHGQFITDLARWSNSYFINRSCDFLDYVPRVDGKTCRQLYGITA